MHPRDLFVVFLRMAGLLLIGGALTHAVNLIGMSAPAELAYYGIIATMLVVGVWCLLGAPALVARLRWPEASAAAPTEPLPPPPATWVAVGERCVAWLFVLEAVPFVAQVIGGWFGGPGSSTSFVGWVTSSSLWAALVNVALATFLFRHSSRRLGVEA
ncbi:MAG: hypothetical protein U1E39_11565 [Planctomycetota bacterium]